MFVEQAIPIEQFSVERNAVAKCLMSGKTWQAPHIGNEMGRARDQIARMTVGDGACHGRDAFPVMAQPDLCPSRACQAIIREKGDERSFRRRYAAISRGPGKEPFFALDDWHVESG
ncbi:MAG: hypothetical protein E5X14_02415, partial [Mesorhizobium sp.]